MLGRITEAASGVKITSEQVGPRTGKSPAKLIPETGSVAGVFLSSLFRVLRGASGLRQEEGRAKMWDTWTPKSDY